MPRADDHHEALVAELHDRAVARGWRRTDCDVADPVVDGADQLVAVQVLVESDRDPGVRQVEALDRAGEQPDGQREDGGDLEVGLLECERSPGGAPSASRRGHRRTRIGEQGASGRREPRATRKPLEQKPADLGLEHPDLLREGRGRHVHSFRGGAERALVRDRDEVLELAEVHGRVIVIGLRDPRIYVIVSNSRAAYGVAV